MALPDLTGQNIQNTYQRILQKSSSGEIVDGTGSLFTPPTASHSLTSISASYALSASHEIIFEISSSYAQTSSYANYLFGQPTVIVNQITASGNISASGTIIAHEIILSPEGSITPASNNQSIYFRNKLNNIVATYLKENTVKDTEEVINGVLKRLVKQK